MNENELNTGAGSAGQAAVPPRKEKLTRKEKKARWKAAKKAKKEELREYYRYAPPLKRAWNLWLGKTLRVILILMIIFGVIAANMPAIYSSIVIPAVRQYYEENKNKPLTEEQLKKIYELSPIDQEGYDRIEALPAVSADETWTICVYMVAADLEDDGENDLSVVTSFLTADAQKELQAKSSATTMERLNRYNQELLQNGLELPKFYYYPTNPVSSSTVMTKDVHVSSRLGCASADIMEMTSDKWSDRIQIVIQTGGATHWSNSMVNPNRTQRFLYKNGSFTEVADLPLQPASAPETLADFLRFCRDEYPADHNMLILWDHGGGPFGYGQDSIFGQMLSLKDIRGALESVYKPDLNDTAFDIIGYDACLMSCLEVTESLEGFADYYCLSEESIPGEGWDYGPWLQAMTDDPTMSPAKVCREIADAYTDHYMIQNINIPFVQMNTTFSVIDAKKASELYDAYSDLARAQLTDAVSDLGALAEIGRCGSRATRYGDNYANIFNTADLGNYADYMIDSYPEQCSRIKDLLKETVLYHRENGGLCDSTGIAVYIPTEVNTLGGLISYLEYVYDICEDESISALYYYKQSGCLNDAMKAYVATFTDAKPKVLDTAPFTAFSKADPRFDNVGFLIPVDDNLQSLMTDYQLEVGRYDADAHTITYYGRDKVLSLDGEGSLCSDFNGSWICLNGEPLYVEVVSSTASAVEYKAHVNYDDKEAYLMITADRDTNTYTITGVRLVDDNNGVNTLVSSRSKIEPEAGKTIVPLYTQTDFLTGETRHIEGEKVTFRIGINISREMLPSGYYLSTAVISDSRGDNYYSKVIGSSVSGKQIENWTLDERFLGRDY